MGPLPSSFGNLYVLLAVDYVSKWVEAFSTPNNDAKTVTKFIHRNIFTRFGTPRAIISVEGSNFCKKVFSTLMAKYGSSIERFWHINHKKMVKLKSPSVR